MATTNGHLALRDCSGVKSSERPAAAGEVNLEVIVNDAHAILSTALTQDRKLITLTLSWTE
jgi:hypothetical protein